MRYLIPLLLFVAACATAPPSTGGGGALGGPDGLPAADRAALRAAGIDPTAIRCNGHRTWSYAVRDDARVHADEILGVLDRNGVVVQPERRDAIREQIRDFVAWRLIRALLVDGDHNNLGVVPVRGLKTADGRPVVLFRTGLTPTPDAPGSCVRSLVEAGGVRHALNLYNGSIPTRDLDEGEQRVLESVGGTYLLAETTDPGAASWRSAIRDDDSEATRRLAMQTVARVVNEQILRPGGQLPRGNVHVHCGGGMHRTGMLVGIIERCIDGLGAEEIAAHYKHHTAWESPEAPGGFEQDNLDFVMTFDCSLLDKP